MTKFSSGHTRPRLTLQELDENQEGGAKLPLQVLGENTDITWKSLQKI